MLPNAYIGDVVAEVMCIGLVFQFSAMTTFLFQPIRFKEFCIDKKLWNCDLVVKSLAGSQGQRKNLHRWFHVSEVFNRYKTGCLRNSLLVLFTEVFLIESCD